MDGAARELGFGTELGFGAPNVACAAKRPVASVTEKFRIRP